MPETTAPAKPRTARKRRLNKSAYVDLAAFRFALRQFLQFSDAKAGSVGITTQQYQALLAIKAQQEEFLSIKELAQAMLLAQNGAVQLVDRLEAQALVTRTASNSDRRSVLITLTPQGAELLAQLAADHLAELIRFEPLLAESLRRLREIGA